MTSTIQKERAQKVIPPEARQKKGELRKVLNDIKSQKEKVPGFFSTLFLRKMGRASFRAGFWARFYAKLELFRASRRFSLLQTLCTRRYEKRTQQAELVGKKAYLMFAPISRKK